MKSARQIRIKVAEWRDRAQAGLDAAIPVDVNSPRFVDQKIAAERLRQTRDVLDDLLRFIDVS